ncbi:MAG: DUF1844 domain-containing protein [Nitrospirae bacterium]|nr:DUF1844 domain-containing protein [Nitrospirota bacterium]
MAESQEKPGEGFRVVDRRYKTFVDEGKSLEEAPKPAPAMPVSRPAAVAPKSDPVSVVQAAARTEPATSRMGEVPREGRSPERPAQAPVPSSVQTPGYKRSPEITFDGFVRSLYTQIMIQLGLVENPLSSEMEVDVEGAKQTIDILDLLKEKTKGNLARQEEQVITEALTASRLAYVETTKRRR